MTNTEKILTAINANAAKLDEIRAAHSLVCARCPGWSGPFHRLFFKSVLDAVPEIKTVLVLGVYLGRDIATILDVAPGRALQVVGVDKFNAEPCDDWPEEKRGKTWEENGFGPPPNAKAALGNINPQLPHAVRLIEADDATWLPAVIGSFDFVYIDTSHDEATVTRQIKQVCPLCHAGTVIAGDDYNDAEKTWGVQKAVNAGFARHQVLAGLIWFAGAEDFK